MLSKQQPAFKHEFGAKMPLKQVQYALDATQLNIQQNIDFY